MSVDASTLVAILAREVGWEALAECLDAAPHPITSAIAIDETALAVARLRDGDLVAARTDVRTFPDAADIAVLAIGSDAADEAPAAFERFGQGRRHPARLNLGDCLAYALAKEHGVPLLFKGNALSRTDVLKATP